MLAVKFEHQVAKGLYAFFRHGVVDAGSDSADATVSFQIDQVALFRGLDELAFEFIAGHAPGDVHLRTAIGAGMPAVKIGMGVEHVVQQLRFLLVPPGHAFQAADILFQPPGHEHQHVDGKHRRRVV